MIIWQIETMMEVLVVVVLAAYIVMLSLSPILDAHQRPPHPSSSEPQLSSCHRVLLSIKKKKKKAEKAWDKWAAAVVILSLTLYLSNGLALALSLSLWCHLDVGIVSSCCASSTISQDLPQFSFQDLSLSQCSFLVMISVKTSTPFMTEPIN